MTKTQNIPNKITVKSVKIVPGKELVSYWQSRMQIVETDHGTFIDNLPGVKFTKNKTAHPGFDWQHVEGKVIDDFNIIDYMGFSWINKG